MPWGMDYKVPIFSIGLCKCKTSQEQFPSFVLLWEKKGMQAELSALSEKDTLGW